MDAIYGNNIKFIFENCSVYCFKTINIYTIGSYEMKYYFWILKQ